MRVVTYFVERETPLYAKQTAYTEEVLGGWRDYLTMLAKSAARFGHELDIVTDTRTDLDGVPGRVHRFDFGKSGAMESLIKARLEWCRTYPDEPALLTDADTFLLTDPAVGFEICTDVDVAIPRRNIDWWWGGEARHGRYVTMGVLYATRPGRLVGLFEAVLKRVERLPVDQRSIPADEDAFNAVVNADGPAEIGERRVIEGAECRFVSMDRYAHIPETEYRPDAVLVHFVGKKRKKLMADRFKRWIGHDA